MPVRRNPLDDGGASVIIGTLLIILVVVIGAAGIALMMSTAQKEEMNRQAHQNAVKNEKLDIDRIILIPNTTTPEKWAYVNFTIVNLDINDATVTITGLYDQNNRTYRYPHSVTAGSSETDPGVLYTLLQDSATPRYADPAGGMLRIPGKKSIAVSISLTNFSDPGPDLHTGDEVRFILYTLLLNNFEKRFIPPAPKVKVSVETEDIGVKRDYLVLDGSDSTDDVSIVEYRWVINQTGISYPPKIGKTVVFKPELNNATEVNLTVTDNTGMQVTSDTFRIPANSQFFPPVKIDIVTNGLSVIASVSDLNGNPVKDITVNFIGTNITFASSPYNQTDIYGKTVVTVNSSGGAVKAVATDYNLQSTTTPV